jgi:hypothetical protein
MTGPARPVVVSERLAAAVADLTLAARRWSHGRRREGIPRMTLTQLERALDEAVDALECAR